VRRGVGAGQARPADPELLELVADVVDRIRQDQGRCTPIGVRFAGATLTRAHQERR
jgi:hypothetical protein